MKFIFLTLLMGSLSAQAQPEGVHKNSNGRRGGNRISVEAQLRAAATLLPKIIGFSENLPETSEQERVVLQKLLDSPLPFISIGPLNGGPTGYTDILGKEITAHGRLEDGAGHARYVLAAQKARTGPWVILTSDDLFPINNADANMQTLLRAVWEYGHVQGLQIRDDPDGTLSRHFTIPTVWEFGAAPGQIPPPDCARDLHLDDVGSFNSAADLMDRAQGRWLLCSNLIYWGGYGVFDIAATAGLDVAPDGQMHYVQRDAESQRLVWRRSLPDLRGKVEPGEGRGGYPPSPPPPDSFYFDFGDENKAATRFSRDGRTMVWEALNNGSGAGAIVWLKTSEIFYPAKGRL